MKQRIFDTLNETVLEIFLSEQDDLGICDGGINPTDSIELDSLMSKMTDLIIKVLDYQPKFGINKDDDGYYFISKTHKRYEILECFSLGGSSKYSSDVIAIFYSGNVDTGENSQIIGHYWGATTFIPDEDNARIIADMVDKYENSIKQEELL